MSKLRIGGVPEHFNYFWKLASTKEVFRNFGFYYEWTDFPGGTGAMSDALENNEIDIAIMLTEGAIASISNGKFFQIQFPLIMSPLIWGVFTSGQIKKPLPDSFAESKFAISRFYSGSHLMAMFLAQREGAKLRDHNFYLSKDLEGARVALNSGEADYFLWEKYMTSPLVQSGEFKIAAEIAAPWPAFVFVIRRGFNFEQDNFKEAVFVSSTEYLQKSKEELLSGICEAFHLKPKDAENWYNEVRYYDNNNYWKDRITAAVIIMHTKGMIQRQPGIEELIG